MLLLRVPQTPARLAARPASYYLRRYVLAQALCKPYSFVFMHKLNAYLDKKKEGIVNTLPQHIRRYIILFFCLTYEWPVLGVGDTYFLCSTYERRI